MSKLPQYGIFENPMDGRVFVIQTRPFFIIAQAFHLDSEQECMEVKRKFTEWASVDYPGEFVFLGAILIFNAPGEGRELADRLAKSMRKMGDWYFAYLQWEDKQQYNSELK